MDKKIIMIISAVAAVVVLAGAGIWLFVHSPSKKADLASQDLEAPGSATGINFETPDLSLSGLSPIETPDMDTVPDLGLDSGQLNMDLPDVDAATPDTSVATPDIDINLAASDIDVAFDLAPARDSGQGNKSAPSAADCAQFESAPSCDYVPQEYRALCEQCK